MLMIVIAAQPVEMGTPAATLVKIGVIAICSMALILAVAYMALKGRAALKDEKITGLEEEPWAQERENAQIEELRVQIEHLDARIKELEERSRGKIHGG